jgi:hypothetical protein
LMVATMLLNWPAIKTSMLLNWPAIKTSMRSSFNKSKYTFAKVIYHSFVHNLKEINYITWIWYIFPDLLFCFVKKCCNAMRWVLKNWKKLYLERAQL